MKKYSCHFLLLLIFLTFGSCQQNFNPTDRSRHQSLVYDDKIWIIGGQGGFGNPFRNDAYYSTDGLTWNEAASRSSFAPRANHAAMVFDDKMWVIGGALANAVGAGTNDVYYSKDGTNWYTATKSAAFSPRDGHATLAYDGKMWVLGGFGGTYTDLKKTMNDVYYSTNGMDWLPATTNAAFSPRHGHASVVYDNKMWVIGGAGSNGRMNDVYYSSDGVNWSAATLNAAFSPRQYHAALVYDGKMWVIGGLSGEDTKNDVYYSTNGIDWIVATENAAFSPRFVHTAVAYDNKMWVIGGGSMGDQGNDVYSSSDGVSWTHTSP